MEGAYHLIVASHTAVSTINFHFKCDGFYHKIDTSIQLLLLLGENENVFIFFRFVVFFSVADVKDKLTFNC